MRSTAGTFVSCVFLELLVLTAASLLATAFVGVEALACEISGGGGAADTRAFFLGGSGEPAMDSAVTADATLGLGETGTGGIFLFSPTTEVFASGGVLACLASGAVIDSTGELHRPASGLGTFKQLPILGDGETGRNRFSEGIWEDGLLKDDAAFVCAAN